MRKVAIFLAIMVLAGVMVEDVQAGWFRRAIRRVGRFVRRIVKPVCRWACPKVCKHYVKVGWVCSFSCKYLCGRKRREIAAAADGHVSPLSGDFDTYDLSDDGKISIIEFACIMGKDSRAEDIEEAFKIADIDGDEYLSEEEFYNGPFVFARNGADDDNQGDDNGNQGDGTNSQGDDTDSQGDDNDSQGDDNDSQGDDNGGQSAETTTPTEEKKRK